MPLFVIWWNMSKYTAGIVFCNIRLQLSKQFAVPPEFSRHDINESNQSSRRWDQCPWAVWIISRLRSGLTPVPALMTKDGSTAITLARHHENPNFIAHISSTVQNYSSDVTRKDTKTATKSYASLPYKFAADPGKRHIQKNGDWFHYLESRLWKITVTNETLLPYKPNSFLKTVPENIEARSLLDCAKYILRRCFHEISSCIFSCVSIVHVNRTIL